MSSFEILLHHYVTDQNLGGGPYPVPDTALHGREKKNHTIANLKECVLFLS